MVATQTQIRRDTASALNSATPVEAELGYDQTNKRLVVGDGLTQGGILHSNYLDIRNSVFLRGTIGGTANAITITLSPAAESYQQGMTIKFLASGTNTGAVTVNVDGLGTRDIEKISAGNLTALAAGDIVSGGYYEIVYDGVQFQLQTLTNSGIVSVSQGDLNTSVGSGNILQVSGVSTETSIAFFLESQGGAYTSYASRITGQAGGSETIVMLPGGQYGFYPQIRFSTIYWQYQQRYITSSPPYDLGDGEVGGFFFATVDNNGSIKQTYIADAPPWAYNGPTDIRATHKCPVTGKKFKRAMKKKSFEEIMDGAPIRHNLEEITHDLKNKDMGLIPHPFGNIPEGHHVVLFDPMDDKIRRIIEYQNAGGDIADSFDKIEIGDSCKRCGPNGVHFHKLKYKYTKKF